MSLELNQPAPEFTLPDLEGRIHMLSDYRGWIVIVNFWSAECPHSERFDADIRASLTSWGAVVALLSGASNANEPDGMLAAVARRRVYGYGGTALLLSALLWFAWLTLYRPKRGGGAGAPAWLLRILEEPPKQRVKASRKPLVGAASAG